MASHLTAISGCCDGSCASHLHPLYERLHDKRLRLVNILPGSWGDQICCRLDTFTLHGGRCRYQALSYVWGRAISKTPLLVNSHKVYVTVNLELALRLLRDQERDVVVWVDALCINQLDMRERSEQVGRMRQIFEGAENVVAFLGHPWMHYPEHRRQALRSLSKSLIQLSDPRRQLVTLDDLTREQAAAQVGKLSAQSSPRSTLEFLSFLAQQESDSTIFDDHGSHFQNLFEGIRTLTTSAWWNRAWILQEIIVPEKATILYGNVTITWDSFSDLLNLIVSKGYMRSLPPEYSKPIRRLIVLTRSIQVKRMDWRVDGKFTSANLFSLLRDLGGRRATDDRDHIYALLSLVGVGKTSLRPDYFLDVAQVYAAATLDILEHDAGSFRVLRGDLSRKGVQNLPSWVPDWSAPFDEVDRQREQLIALHQSSLTPSATARTLDEADLPNHNDATLDEYETFLVQLHAVFDDMDPVIWNLHYLLERLRSVQDEHTMLDGALSDANAFDEWYRKLPRRETSGIKLAEAISHASQRFPDRYRLGSLQVGQEFAKQLQASRLGEISLLLSPPILVFSFREGSDEVSYLLRGIRDLVATTKDYGILAELDWFDLRPNDYDINPHGNPSYWKIARALIWDIIPDVDGKLRRFNLRSARDRKLFCTWWLSHHFQSLMSGRVTKEEDAMHKIIDGVFLKGSAQRRFFSMIVGFHRAYGWGPKHMEKGDIVYQFPGSETPFVLRRRGRHVIWIGDCFVQDHMGGISSLPDYNRYWRRWLEHAVVDLLDFRRLCKHDSALTIDGVVAQVRAAILRLEYEYQLEERSSKEEEEMGFIDID